MIVRLSPCAVKEAYNCKHAVVIPGSGTYAMEACARQFATGKKAIVIRNGYFSYRWTQIFEACGIPTDHIVLKAKPVNPGAPTNELQYAPHPIEDVVETILREKPGVVFAPHVETSVGMMVCAEARHQTTTRAHVRRGWSLHALAPRVASSDAEPCVLAVCACACCCASRGRAVRLRPARSCRTTTSSR